MMEKWPRGRVSIYILYGYRKKTMPKIITIIIIVVVILIKNKY